MPRHTAIEMLHTARSRISTSYKVRLFCERLWLGWMTVRALARRPRLSTEIRRREQIQIHFGCGEIDDSRFINVDARPFAHVHLVTQSPTLRAFRREAVESIYACHVLEHFPFARHVPILQRWYSLLAPGGTLRLSVPDFDKLISRYESHDSDAELIKLELMGGQDYPGNFHYAIFTHNSLSQLLSGVGFVNIKSWHPQKEADWPRDYSWEDHISLNLIGEKPR